MSEPRPLDAGPILATLDRHHVEYVLIGGFAAQQHGATRPTEDMDITPASDADNLARLAAALRDLDARIRVAEAPDGLPFDTSAEALRGVSMLNLRCPHSDFDISFTPARHRRLLRPDPLRHRPRTRRHHRQDRQPGRHHPLQDRRRPRRTRSPYPNWKASPTPIDRTPTGPAPDQRSDRRPSPSRTGRPGSNSEPVAVRLPE